MIQSPSPNDNEDAKVAALIEIDLNKWNIRKLSNLFSFQDAHPIQSIPLCIGRMDDNLV